MIDCPVLAVQRRKQAEAAIAKGGVVVTELQPGAKVDVRQQGNLEMYTDVRPVVWLPAPSLENRMGYGLCTRMLQTALLARQTLMANETLVGVIRDVGSAVVESAFAYCVLLTLTPARCCGCL